MPDDSLIGHLEALRGALIRCVAAVALLYAPAYFAAPHAIDWLTDWAVPDGLGDLYFFSPLEAFLVRLKLALALACIAAFPYCAWQAWSFLLPALYAQERRAFGGWIAASALLFACGAAFCLAFILPLLMKFSLTFAGPRLTPAISLAGFLELAGVLALAFGVTFQFPLAVMLAVRFGLVSAASLRSKRPFVIVAILIVAAVLTPPDVISQIMMAVPIWLLFEIGLWFAARFDRKEERPAANPCDGMLDFYDGEAKR